VEINMRRSFSVGGVVGDSLSVWMKNFLPYFLLGLLMFTPLVALQYMLVTGTDLGVAAAIVPVALTVLLQMALTGSVVYGVFQQMSGEKPSIATCLSVGMTRMFPILGVAIVTGLLIGVGMMLLLIPGLILMCMWWVVIPVAVVERPGLAEAMSRSADLTKGYRWQVLGIVLVVGVLGSLAQFVIEQVLDPTALISLVTAGVASAFFGVWGAVAQAVGYHDLRVTKEGANTKAIAAAFD